jgi:site-specific recombinase XerD
MTEFIKYMESKNHSKRTQQSYLKYVELFLKWYKMDAINCTKKNVLDYLAYLKKHTKQQNNSRRSSITALNHYFTALLQAGEIDKNPVAFIKMRGANKNTFTKSTRLTNLHNLQTIFTPFLYRALMIVICCTRQRKNALF